MSHVETDPAVSAKVDTYLGEVLNLTDPVLDAVLAANAAAGLPPIDVSAAQGRMLALFVAMTGAKRVLEIGALGGYSTICLARALPAGGQVVTIEREAAHAEVARRNFERAGMADRIDLRVGAALDVLPTLEGPFDLVFVDADKLNNPGYFDWALRLSRPGTTIVFDNVIRSGAVADTGSADPNVQGSQAALRLLGNHPRLRATAIQTVGAKGWDGFALAVVGE
ncbi:O-methyltransferase [Aureimonas sp. AU40]|uniref:O-methyltransferase n=1 Tax=Aureimonas sp. AU40 TaxID=1637747 RepID=UPI0007814A01|nr:O-methyltransferase [Aureimonas sp. AU40]